MTMEENKKEIEKENKKQKRGEKNTDWSNLNICLSTREGKI